jgi:transposase-like protein
MSTESRKLIEVTKKIEDELGVRFCTACNLTKAAHGGKVKPLSNGRSRWMCALCAKRMTESIYKRKHA